MLAWVGALALCIWTIKAVRIFWRTMRENRDGNCGRHRSLFVDHIMNAKPPVTGD